jgi:hypothetical protein
MRFGRFVTATMVASVIVSAARAEAAGDGYVTVGAGIFTNYYTSGSVRQFSGGGEGRFGGHFGVGGDGSFVVGGGDAFVAVALQASVHSRDHNRAVHMDPFVRGGYSRLSFLTEPGGSNALHIGGGFAYWFSDKRAWVAEFRAVSPMVAVTSRYWIASVGIGFR